MITRHHLVLVLMGTLILGIALFPTNMAALGMLALGACTGAVLPDIHMTRPKRFGLRSISWAITRFSAGICIPVLCATFYRSCGLNLCPSDKRLTHSVPGFLVVGAVVATVPLLALQFFPVPLPLPAFVAGILCGFALHLIEDVCTKKGITPLYPFSTVRIAGSIRPCDQTDSRIGRYHVHHGCMAIAIFGLQSILHWQGPLSLEVSLLGLLSCLALMVFLSDVHIEAGTPAEDRFSRGTDPAP